MQGYPGWDRGVAYVPSKRGADSTRLNLHFIPIAMAVLLRFKSCDLVLAFIMLPHRRRP